MSVDCLVGLQYGSEGKGKWAGVMAAGYQHSVRVGAPNAGHTVYKNGVAHKMRQIPCAWVNEGCKLYIGAGGMVNLSVLREELVHLPLEVMKRLFIDINACVLQPEDTKHEEQQSFNAFNGSTSEGVGQAQARKVLRKYGVVASMAQELEPYWQDTKRKLWSADESGENILVEGTQGYGLCLDHGKYPFVTSRNVLASSLLSDVGFAPSACTNVFGVLRTYPIRVAGNSGPMGAEEITWEEVARRAGLPPICERTTVTNRVRRVSEIDWWLLEDACRANEPDGIFVSFIDYIDGKLTGSHELADLNKSDKAVEFIAEVENRLGVSVLAVSTGPKPEDVIKLPSYGQYVPECGEKEAV